MLSLARYAVLLAQPKLRETILASVLGRLPVGITGLAILLHAQEAAGSMASAGAVAAAYVVGLAAAAPLLGRLIDRHGPRPVLLACAFAFPSALAALLSALATPLSLSLSYAFATAAGASFPPITVCMRTFFRQRLQEEALLATAYSLESVLIELVFILGPLLVAGFAAISSPATAILFAAACCGSLLFLASPALKDWPLASRPRPGRRWFGPLAEPGFPTLLAVIVCYASAFGLVEIGTTAYAANPGLAGVLLGIMSIGSVAGGLVYGSRNWSLPLTRQFPLTLALMGLGVAPLAALSSVWTFGLACLVAGIAMAPALIMQSMLVARSAKHEFAAEAFTWASSALLAGVGLGLSLGGALLERAESPLVFSVAAAVSLAAGLLAWQLLKSRSS